MRFTPLFCRSQIYGLTRPRLIDSPISTPCSQWEKYRKSRTQWGINVLGSFLIEIEASDGTVGFATGFGGQQPGHIPSSPLTDWNNH